MILIARASFPRSSLKEAIKIFSQLPKLPATVKRSGPFFPIDDKGNFNYISFFKFNEQQITVEQKKFLQKRFDVFAGVPGFTSSIENWMSMEETLELLKKKKDSPQSG
ncbi:MAG: hypothetical protein KKC76_00040 [Proteobacteria bacterium]|nr:hypothetical protein [Pseudomonadota bacterium]MBU4297588.1 hypothetical protein [Pseudomonadota bacterium]MCG2748854.1 hypothetical protein [Desulfobulbaceae bacterium]